MLICSHTTRDIQQHLPAEYNCHPGELEPSMTSNLLLRISARVFSVKTNMPSSKWAPKGKSTSLPSGPRAVASSLSTSNTSRLPGEGENATCWLDVGGHHCVTTAPCCWSQLTRSSRWCCVRKPCSKGQHAGEHAKYLRAFKGSYWYSIFQLAN